MSRNEVFVYSQERDIDSWQILTDPTEYYQEFKLSSDAY